MKSVWTTGVLALALLLGLAAYLAPLQPPLVALQLTFSHTAFDAVLQQWGPQGVALFRSHLGPDYLLLLAYGAFGYLLVQRSRLFVGSALPLALWRWTMPLAAAADAVEDAVHWAATAPGAVLGDGWHLLAGLCASAKLALFVGFLLAAAWRGWVLRRSA